MLKKITHLSCLSFLTLSTALFADAKDTPNEVSPEIYSGGYTVETSVNTSPNGSNPFLTFGYIGKCFLFDPVLSD